jgi:hypothetical protein
MCDTWVYVPTGNVGATFERKHGACLEIGFIHLKWWSSGCPSSLILLYRVVEKILYMCVSACVLHFLYYSLIVGHISWLCWLGVLCINTEGWRHGSCLAILSFEEPPHWLSTSSSPHILNSISLHDDWHSGGDIESQCGFNFYSFED